MLRKILYIISFMLIVLSFTSCDNFLNEPPAKTGVIPKTVKDLQGYYYYGIRRNNCKYRTSISDDIELPFTKSDIESHNGFSKYISEFYSVLFQRDILSKRSYGNGTWGKCYGEIHNDNYVLSMADSKKLTGTSKERELVKSFARFDRARNMFDLVTSYCKPYAPGKNDKDLGIVLINKYSLDFNKDNLGRKTLKESYDFIEKDMLSAMNLPDAKEKWLPTGKAVCAFAARFYLMEGKYDDALKYAELALKQKSDLDDYTTYSMIDKTERNIPIKIVPEIYNKLIYDDMSIYDVNQEYLIETQQVENSYIPSKELLALYDKDAGTNDVRRQLFPTNGLGSHTNFLRSKPSTIKGTTGEYPFYSGYNHGTMMLSFPNVPEIMLIKAECLVETKGDISGAKALLNTLRSKRIKNYDSKSVDKLASKDDVLQFIYNERRRERPFILRSLDIRRLKAIKGKDIIIIRDFFDMSISQILVPAQRKVYTLSDNDYVNKLYEGDITLSNGLLKQNP